MLKEVIIGSRFFCSLAELCNLNGTIYYSSFYIEINSMYLTQKLKSGYTYMVPQIKAGELKFLVGWGRIRPGRRRRRSRRLSNPDFWNKASRIAAAWGFPARLRHCLVFVNKICQSRDADLHMVFRLFCFNKSLTKTALFEPFCLFGAILGHCATTRQHCHAARTDGSTHSVSKFAGTH